MFPVFSSGFATTTIFSLLGWDACYQSLHIVYIYSSWSTQHFHVTEHTPKVRKPKKQRTWTQKNLGQHKDLKGMLESVMPLKVQKWKRAAILQESECWVGCQGARKSSKLWMALKRRGIGKKRQTDNGAWDSEKRKLTWNEDGSKLRVLNNFFGWTTAFLAEQTKTLCTLGSSLR